MAKKKSLKLLSLFALLLACTFILSPVGQSANASLSAIADADGEFDYAAVMSEPDALVGTNSAPLSRAELKSMKLYVGGVPFGVKFITEGLLVVGFCDVDSSTGKTNPISAAGLRIGDRILSADGKRLVSASELAKLIEQSGGRSISIVYRRGQNEYSTALTPAFSKSENCYKSGAYVKDNGAGIGTVTYVIPKTLEFAGLGHGICEGEGGKLVPISRGSVINVGIDGVIKGQCGTPGELKGHFKSGKCGTLLQNSDCGVFGVLTSLPQNLPTQPLSLGLRDEIRDGKAYIYCTLDAGAPKRYEIEISNIDRDASAGKCFTVKVCDQSLIAKTGGIVQGMSGSPIIQNGKLVGAVTHVLINDPTTGYGIFIENMLNAANIPMAKAS